ncbi:MAG: response regulator transcription factor [Chloroflexota bacterium]
MINLTEILVVDDEPQIRKLLRAGLSGYGYQVMLASNSQDAIALVARDEPDIIVLDINLGFNSNGLDVCRQLREWSLTPIIMLTVNNNRQTILEALNAGADDYITKPFNMEELEARVRAVLRRTAVEKSDSPRSVVRVHDLVLDLVKRRVMLNGDEIHLTPTEYKLLCTLALNPGRVLTFSALLQAIEAKSEAPKSAQYVRVYINTLRKKLHDDTASTARPLYIYNEPGVGYRFADLQPAEHAKL